MTALSDLLNEAKGDATPDDLIREARRRGVDVSPSARSNMYKALNGQHAKQPKDATLQLYAAVFRVDVRTLRNAVGRPAGELGPWIPPEESDRRQRTRATAAVEASRRE